jgi:adenine-specific DNA glycosylase
VPDTIEQLCSLPGIGDYAARAILSFGYGTPVAVVDGNVERVLGRVFAHCLVTAPTSTTIQKIADDLLTWEHHREFNFALLDLGSLICRPARPLCNECPLQSQCDFAQGPQNDQHESKLRNARQAKGMSLTALAKKAGVSKLTIVNIEAGRTLPREETLFKISQALGVTLEEI